MFITQTGPKKNKEAQSQIRKHVMKDIGRARRKDGRRVIPLHFTLEIPDSLEALTRPEVAQPQDPERHPIHPRATGRDPELLNRNTFEPLQPNDPLDEIERAMERAANQQLSVMAPSIERVWTGRMNPFIRYPIKMDEYSLRLMDHGKLDPFLYSN